MQIYAALARPYGIDPAEIQALAEIESGHYQHKDSLAGAIGIMQIMPDTGLWFCKLRPWQLRNATLNLRCGTAYYAYLREKYKNPVLAVAAYNAGPGWVDYYGAVPPFFETQRHVVKWKAAYGRLKPPEIQKGISSSGKSPEALVGWGYWSSVLLLAGLAALSFLPFGIKVIRSQTATCFRCFWPF